MQITSPTEDVNQTTTKDNQIFKRKKRKKRPKYIYIYIGSDSVIPGAVSSTYREKVWLGINGCFHAVRYVEK